MIARLSITWDRVRNSLWGVPIALIIAGGAFAVLAVHVRLPSRADPVWWLYSGDAAAAFGFLANLLTAMITMATLAISITMVVLTLAAQSLGPRLISIFMGDTRTKLALGIFLGTTVYLLIALRTVVGATDSVPNLAITVGTALVLTSIVVLLFFVHHLARSIVADTIIRRVGEALDQSIHRLLPQEKDEAPTPPRDWQPIRDTGRHFRAKVTGYIQASGSTTSFLSRMAPQGSKHKVAPTTLTGGAPAATASSCASVNRIGSANTTGVRVASASAATRSVDRSFNVFSITCCWGSPRASPSS